MTPFISVCLAILTLTHLTGLIILVVVLIQIHRSAQAVEIVAYQAHGQLQNIGDTTKKVNDFAGTILSGWTRAALLGLGALVTLWPKHSSKD